MIEKAKSSHVTPSQIYSEIVVNCTTNVLAELPREDYLKRTIRGNRGHNDPAKPKTINDIIIEGEWSLYREERFLLHDNRKSNERIIMFATDYGLSLLAEAQTWFSKKRDLYPDPLNFNLDFEVAVINAAKLIFGNDISIRGCFYHLCQSTYREVQELGLSNRYQENEGFRLFCAMIDSLAFLPLNKVKEGMEYLKQNIPNEADDLLIYFEAYIKIKNEVAADLAKLALNDEGEPFNKIKKLGLTQTTEKRLKELCTRIQNDEINVEDFLKAIAHNIRKRCND
ncbi:hypothetical protein QTP88_007520 [Uroleucon formosanum]